MPDFEPNPDAPVTVWAGEYDAQVIADATGASWAAPIFALNQPRVVNIADLCSAPPPSAPTFTTTDLVQAINPFADNTALRQKLQNFVDNGLHRTWCTAVDVPPLPPMPSNPPPADLPPEPIPPTDSEKRQLDMYRWLRWMVREFVPRSYHGGAGALCSGQGYMPFAQDGDGEWSVWPAGVFAQVQEKPDYVGRSNGGDFPVYYDLGWFTLAGQDPVAQSPIRLQHSQQFTYGSTAAVHGVYYNLAPGVEVFFTPIWPETATPIAE